MIKTILYVSLLLFGVGATLFNPLVGAISCLEAYLLNPIVVTEVDLRFQLITTLAFLISIFQHNPQGLHPVGRELSVLKALWAFVAIGALSSLWAQVSAQDTIVCIIEVAKTVLLASLLVRVIRSEQQFTYIIAACVAGVLHASFLHTIGIRLGYAAPIFQKIETGVLPDGQGSVMVLFLPTLLLLAIMGRRYERILCWLSLPFVLSSIVTTNQRTYFLAMVVQCGLILLLLPKRIVLRLLPVIAVGVGLFMFRLTSEDYWKRMSTIKTPTEEASANSRFIINEASRRMLMDYPIGVGYRNYPRVSPRYLPLEYLTEGMRSAHNSFYTVACETGILGFAIWAYAFVGSLWLLRRIRKTANKGDISRVVLFAMGLEIGFYGWLCGGYTQSDHEIDPAYWFVAFTVVLTRLHHRERSVRVGHV